MAFKEWSSTKLLTREYLISLRLKALRRHIWFGTLSNIERGMVELTIRCVDRIRSTRLALVISRIVCKILKAFRSKFLERVERVGCNLAERISRIAVSWGCVEASGWKRDPVFIRYLGVNAVNNI